MRTLFFLSIVTAKLGNTLFATTAQELPPHIRIVNNEIHIDYHELSEVDRAALHHCFGHTLEDAIDAEKVALSTHEFKAARELRALFTKVKRRSQDCNPNAVHKFIFKDIPIKFMKNGNRYYRTDERSYTFCLPAIFERATEGTSRSRGNHIRFYWGGTQQDSRLDVKEECHNYKQVGPSGQTINLNFGSAFSYKVYGVVRFFVQNELVAEQLYDFALGRENYVNIKCRPYHLSNLKVTDAGKIQLVCAPTEVTFFRNSDSPKNVWGSMKLENGQYSYSTTLK